MRPLLESSYPDYKEKLLDVLRNKGFIKIASNAQAACFKVAYSSNRTTARLINYDMTGPTKSMMNMRQILL